MKAVYICDYLHNSGKICNKACTRPKGCRLHHKAKKRPPCTEPGCGKPIRISCGQCRLHVRGYYMIQYINRLQVKALGAQIYYPDFVGLFCSLENWDKMFAWKFYDFIVG